MARSFPPAVGIGQAGAMVRVTATFVASKPGSFWASAIGPGPLAQPVKNARSVTAINTIVPRLIIGDPCDSTIEICRALGLALILKRTVPPPVGDETREEFSEPLQDGRDDTAHAGDFFENTDQAAVPMMTSAPTT